MSVAEFVKAYRELVKKIGAGDALRLSGGIFRSFDRARVFLDLCDKGSTTVPDVVEELGMSETTAYRVLSDLRELEVIEVTGRVRRHEASVGGSPANIWRLRDGSKMIDLEN